MTDHLEFAADAVQEAIRCSTVGIVSGSGSRQFQGIGTASLVRWNQRHLILTGAHVVGNTTLGDLRFFLPFSKPAGRVEREQLRKMPGVRSSSLSPFSELRLSDVSLDAALDLAAFHVDERLNGQHPAARFFDLRPGGATPGEEQTVVAMGYPRDLGRQTLANEGVVFLHTEWTNVAPNQSGLEDFDPTVHFLARYSTADEYGDAEPIGLSGSAMWFHHKTAPGLWHPNMDIGGVTIGWYRKARLLKVVRREIVERFLTTQFDQM